MAYVQGFLLAVPTRNRAAYLKMAQTAAAVFKDHGASEVCECWGDDVPEGKLTSFPMAVKKTDDETVVFAWTVWPSKADCDAGGKAAMEDPRMAAMMDPKAMPFDGNRMIWGGFEVILKV